jgi:hypothetical protein
MPSNLVLNKPAATAGDIWGAQLNQALDDISSWVNRAKVYDVRRFGAICDDNTYDGPKVLDAINTCSSEGGGIVRVSGRCYTWQDSFAIPSNVMVQGIGREASWLRRDNTATTPLLNFSGTDSNNHRVMQGVADISLHGSQSTGGLIRAYYCDNLHLTNVNLFDNASVMFDAVELWDTYLTDVTFHTGGGAAGSGIPMMWLRNASAATGFGSSADNTNMVWLQKCRFEVQKGGAIRMERGNAANTNELNGIFLHQIKCESHTVGGPGIVIDGSTSHIELSQIEMFMGQYAPGFSTPQPGIVLQSFGGASIRDLRVVNGADGLGSPAQTVSRWLDVTANGPLTIDRVTHRATPLPVDSVVYFSGGSGKVDVRGVSSTDGATLFGPANAHPGNRIQTWAASLPVVCTAPDTVIRTTVTANTTVQTPTGMAIKDRLAFEFTCGGTAFTITWPSAIKSSLGALTINKVNRVDLEWNGTNWIQVGQPSAV